MRYRRPRAHGATYQYTRAAPDQAADQHASAGARAHLN